MINDVKKNYPRNKATGQSARLIDILSKVKSGKHFFFNQEYVNEEGLEIIETKLTEKEFYDFCFNCYHTIKKFKKLKDQYLDCETHFDTVWFDHTIEEILFYNISNGDKILDIDADYGITIDFLYHINPQNKYYIQEKNKLEFAYLNEHYSAYKNIEVINEISYDSLQKNIDFDLILIKNGINHFSEKRLALISFIDLLNSDGRLIVAEQFYDEYDDNFKLSDLSKNEFYDLMEELGFILVKEQLLTDTREIFEYKIE